VVWRSLIPRGSRDLQVEIRARLDEILESVLAEGHLEAARVIGAGLTEEVVEREVLVVDANEHRRERAPRLVLDDRSMNSE
jgi:hypothetical protein